MEIDFERLEAGQSSRESGKGRSNREMSEHMVDFIANLAGEPNASLARSFSDLRGGVNPRSNRWAIAELAG